MITIKNIDLKGIRSKIEKQRDAILSRIRRLRREDPFATEDRAIIVEPGSDAAALFGHEQVAVFEGRLREELKEVEKALGKIKTGTYGKCERCRKVIDPARLEVKPSAIYCLKCEKEIEKKRRS